MGSNYTRYSRHCRFEDQRIALLTYLSVTICLTSRVMERKEKGLAR